MEVPGDETEFPGRKISSCPLGTHEVISRRENWNEVWIPGGGVGLPSGACLFTQSGTWRDIPRQGVGGPAPLCPLSAFVGFAWEEAGVGGSWELGPEMLRAGLPERGLCLGPQTSEKGLEHPNGCGN